MNSGKAIQATYTAHQLAAAMEQGHALYVDVRSHAEFVAGHAVGAIHVALYEQRVGKRVLQRDFVQRIKNLHVTSPPATVLVLACRTGARSRQAVQVLLASGMNAVADFPGGWCGQSDPWGRTSALGWRDAGLPVTSS